MKHNANPRRGRNRGNGKRYPTPRNQTFESNGPDGKIRGTAQQVLERYLALGRDAYSAGDPITAESYYQHAEHYFRISHAYDEDDRSRRSNGEAAVAVADAPTDPVATEQPEEDAPAVSA